MRKIIYGLVFILLIPALSACGYFVQKEPEDSTAKLDLSAGKLGFALVHENIFRPRCVQCHAQYDTYEGVRRESAAILSAVQANRMPKNGGPLSSDLKSALKAWIEAGSPEFPGQSPTPPVPVTLEPAWSSLSPNIFVPLCVSCHNPNGQARFLDLSTYESFVAAKDRVFGDGKKLLDLDSPASSYLLEVLQDETEPMPPRWSNLRRLTPEETEVLRRWIESRLPAERAPDHET